MRTGKGEGRVDWIVLGLGNPGPDYEGTRHNAGFEVVQRLAARHGVSLRQVAHHARFACARVGGVPVLLAEPLTYMNRSGIAALALTRHFHVPVERLLVVVDDVALPLGMIRVRKSGSAGGHNGLRSLIESLGSAAFPRVRVGIGAPPSGQMVEYVLAPFSRQERAIMEEAFERAADAVEVVVERGLDVAMNTFNARSRGPAT